MTSESLDNRAKALVNRAVVSRYPVIYVISPEEERIENVLTAISRDHFQDDRPVVRWTASQGFEPDIGAGDQQTDPVAAIEFIKSQDEDRIYLMKDLPGYFSRDHRIEADQDQGRGERDDDQTDRCRQVQQKMIGDAEQGGETDEDRGDIERIHNQLLL